MSKIQDEMRRTMAGEVSLADYPEDEDSVETELETVSEEAGTAKKIAIKTGKNQNATLYLPVLIVIQLWGFQGRENIL